MQGHNELKCLECDSSFINGKSLSNHVKNCHRMTGEDYTIKHLYKGLRPLCLSCESQTRYASFQFKKYCKSCSSIAMREGGSKGGKAEAWNKGKTADCDLRIKQIADKMRGSGNPFFGRSHDDLTRTKISISKRLMGETIESRVLSRSSDFELITPIEEYVSRQRQYLEFRCKKCGDIQQKTLQAFERGSLCEKCHPLTASQWQLEVEEFVSSLGFNVERGNRKTLFSKEIDIFVPDKRFGIECHGLYFHSEAKDGCDPKLHATKATLAENAGVRLLQIFHDEWRDRNYIVKQMIRSRLGIADRKIGARKCKVIQIDAKTQRQFFESSHLAGYAPAQNAWALEYNGEILSCLSVRVPRQEKWRDRLEISRYATTPGVIVVGGLSRLARAALEHAIESGHSGLMTYVDRRVGFGSGYLSCGFEEVGQTGPDYWYTDMRSRFDRFKFKASSGISEREIASKSGVFRIWGAGSKILTLS